MSENMIILNLLENAQITFEEALQLLNAVCQNSQTKNAHQPTDESEKGINVNIHFERLMDV